MSVGSELRWAREQAGLSVEQIAERTKIQPHRIESLERNNFAGLPGGIYLDGIVRAYASEVAIDPEALVDRVRHERARVANVRDLALGEIDAALEELSGDEPHPPPAVDRFRESPLSETGGIGIRPANEGGITNRGRVRPPPGLLSVEDEPATPVTSQEPVGATSRLRWLALPLVSLLAVAGWGAYFYEVAHRADRDVTPDLATSAPKAASPAEPSPATTDPSVPSDATADAVPRQTTGIARNVPPPTPSPAPAAPASAATAPVRDVSGAWTMATNVESSSLADFVGLRLGYEIQLDQAGDRITGEGRKVTEKGAAIGSQAQTPISLAGTIAGDRLTLTFTERGTERSTQGKFVLLVEDGTLRGRFSSTAAQSSGTVEAHRK